MSCEGAATAAACKSRQSSRIFREQRCSYIRVEKGPPACDTLLDTPNDRKTEEETIKRDKRIRRNESCSYWATGGHTTTNGKSADVETVADIDKWLKTRTESASSMDLDAAAKVVEGVDLGEELSHVFLGKDPYGLSIDIDLSDKKFNLGYDPILQNLQSEKLLEPCCEKVDEFMLPEFQLHYLDPLSLSSDDMLVAGEVLPSTSNQSMSNVNNNRQIEQPIEHSERQCEIICEKSTRLIVDTSRANLENINETIATRSQHNNSQALSSGNSSELLTEILTMEENVSKLDVEIDPPDAMIDRLKAKSRIKLEPRIIKKRGQLTQRLEKKFDKRMNGRSLTDSQDGVMAVVAISTDKISNMTQIVINTGKEKQIYQGKTSELIEATGNFPKLPKIDTSAIWNGTVEYNIDNNPNSQYEIIISNALEELGITDDSLQPICVTEHDKVWLCPRDDCNRQFGRLYTLKGHLLAHYGVRPFKCDFEGCTWAFYSEFKLKRHKETHLKRKDYVCEVEGCNRRFTTIYNLWSHEKLHSRPNRIICQVPNCEEKFQTKRALELHMKSHDQRHAPYVCQHEGCGKRYYSSNALTSHQRSHSYKEVDVKCSWPGCGKVFDKPCRLKAHTRSHTGCKPYHCTFQDCKWAFSSSSKLKRHQKKHTNERKFICDILGCGKAFMRSEHLKEHRLTHTEGRYFQCFVCDAKFSAKSSLYVHIKKHQTKIDLGIGTAECTSNNTLNKKRIRTTESRCSRIKPIVKSKSKLMELNLEAVCLPDRKQHLHSEQANARNCIEDPASYHCPLEICTHSYSTEAALRLHVLKAHRLCMDSSMEEHDESSVKPSQDINMDYILYAMPSSNSPPAEQMDMVTACDTVILGASSETDRCLPEPEPPPIDNLARNTESSAANDGAATAAVTKRTVSVSSTRRNQGSARTSLTFSDVSKLKTNSIAETSDVASLGASDPDEGLLITEELPSMYYQDEPAGTEYQVLLLDSGPLESAGNLRGLE